MIDNDGEKGALIVHIIPHLTSLYLLYNHRCYTVRRFIALNVEKYGRRGPSRVVLFGRVYQITESHIVPLRVLFCALFSEC